MPPHLIKRSPAIQSFERLLSLRCQHWLSSLGLPETCCLTEFSFYLSELTLIERKLLNEVVKKALDPEINDPIAYLFYLLSAPFPNSYRILRNKLKIKSHLNFSSQQDVALLIEQKWNELGQKHVIRTSNVNVYAYKKQKVFLSEEKTRELRLAARGSENKFLEMEKSQLGFDKIPAEIKNKIGYETRKILHFPYSSLLKQFAKDNARKLEVGNEKILFDDKGKEELEDNKAESQPYKSNEIIFDSTEKPEEKITINQPVFNEEEFNQNIKNIFAQFNLELKKRSEISSFKQAVIKGTAVNNLTLTLLLATKPFVNEKDHHFFGKMLDEVKDNLFQFINPALTGLREGIDLTNLLRFSTTSNPQYILILLALPLAITSVIISHELNRYEKSHHLLKNIIPGGVVTFPRLLMDIFSLMITDVARLKIFNDQLERTYQSEQNFLQIKKEIEKQWEVQKIKILELINKMEMLAQGNEKNIVYQQLYHFFKKTHATFAEELNNYLQISAIHSAKIKNLHEERLAKITRSLLMLPLNIISKISPVMELPFRMLTQLAYLAVDQGLIPWIQNRNLLMHNIVNNAVNVDLKLDSHDTEKEVNKLLRKLQTSFFHIHINAPTIRFKKDEPQQAAEKMLADLVVLGQSYDIQVYRANLVLPYPSEISSISEFEKFPLKFKLSSQHSNIFRQNDFSFAIETLMSETKNIISNGKILAAFVNELTHKMKNDSEYHPPYIDNIMVLKNNLRWQLEKLLACHQKLKNVLAVSNWYWLSKTYCLDEKINQLYTILQSGRDIANDEHPLQFKSLWDYQQSLAPHKLNNVPQELIYKNLEARAFDLTNRLVAIKQIMNVRDNKYQISNLQNIVNELKKEVADYKLDLKKANRSKMRFVSLNNKLINKFEMDSRLLQMENQKNEQPNAVNIDSAAMFKNYLAGISSPVDPYSFQVLNKNRLDVYLPRRITQRIMDGTCYEEAGWHKTKRATSARGMAQRAVKNMMVDITQHGLIDRHHHHPLEVVFNPGATKLTRNVLIHFGWRGIDEDGNLVLEMGYLRRLHLAANGLLKELHVMEEVVCGIKDELIEEIVNEKIKRQQIRYKELFVKKQFLLEFYRKKSIKYLQTTLKKLNPQSQLAYVKFGFENYFKTAKGQFNKIQDVINHIENHKPREYKIIKMEEKKPNPEELCHDTIYLYKQTVLHEEYVTAYWKLKNNTVVKKTLNMNEFKHIILPTEGEMVEFDDELKYKIKLKFGCEDTRVKYKVTEGNNILRKIKQTLCDIANFFAQGIEKLRWSFLKRKSHKGNQLIEKIKSYSHRGHDYVLMTIPVKQAIDDDFLQKLQLISDKFNDKSIIFKQGNNIFLYSFGEKQIIQCFNEETVLHTLAFPGINDTKILYAHELTDDQGQFINYLQQTIPSEKAVEIKKRDADSIHLRLNMFANVKEEYSRERHQEIKEKLKSYS